MLSFLILLNEHSAVVDRFPFAAAVPPFPPLLCLLLCVVLTILGRMSLTPLGRPLPMMMCIPNTPFQEIPTARLLKTHETHEIRGHVTRRAGAPSNFCTATSFPMPCWGLKNYVSESWGTQKRTQKTFKPTLFIQFRRTQKFHHNEARAFLGTV